MYEVTLSIQRLVNKYGNELWNPTWSIILDIIEEIIIHTGKLIKILYLIKENNSYHRATMYSYICMQCMCGKIMIFIYYFRNQ